jgi:hypothetical protein
VVVEEFPTFLGLGCGDCCDDRGELYQYLSTFGCIVKDTRHKSNECSVGKTIIPKDPQQGRPL